MDILSGDKRLQYVSQTALSWSDNNNSVYQREVAGGGHWRAGMKPIWYIHVTRTYLLLVGYLVVIAA